MRCQALIAKFEWFVEIGIRYGKKTGVPSTNC